MATQDTPPASAPKEDIVDMTPREGKGLVAKAAAPAAPAGTTEAQTSLAYIGRIYNIDNSDDDGAVFSEESPDRERNVLTTPGEHIDVVVPSTRNKAQAAIFLGTAASNGPLTNERLKELADAGISHKTLHLAGASYHFEQGGDPTSVPESHAAWLLTNPHYAFKRV